MTFEADFVSQIKGNNHIAGRTRITKIGNKSFHLEQDIIDTDTQEVKSHCTFEQKELPFLWFLLRIYKNPPYYHDKGDSL